MSRPGRPPSAHLLALDGQILTVLDGATAPMATTTIAARLGLHVADHVTVYHRLAGLEARGQIVGIREDGVRATYWALRIADVDTRGLV